MFPSRLVAPCLDRKCLSSRTPNLIALAPTAKSQMVPPLGTIWTANKKFGGAVLGSGLEGGGGFRVRSLNHLFVRGFHHAHVLS